MDPQQLRLFVQDKETFEKVGNVIQNASTKNINGSINFAKFYKNLGLDKLLLSKNDKKKTKNTGDFKGFSKPASIKNKKQKFGKKVLQVAYNLMPTKC